MPGPCEEGTLQSSMLLFRVYLVACVYGWLCHSAVLGVNNFIVRKSCVMTLGAPLTPWLRRYIKSQGVAPWSLLEPSCRYTFPSACLCQQLLPDKDCLKNKTTLEPEVYPVYWIINITDLTGGCTRLPLPQLIFCFLSGMPTPKRAALLPSLPVFFHKAKPVCQGQKAEKPDEFPQNLFMFEWGWQVGKSMKSIYIFSLTL